MSKKAVIYWSGTGNTEAMATAIVEGIKNNGAEADFYNVSDITADKASEYDVLILGCPAMGAEVLEEGEFEPFFTELEGKISGKKVALFGSYGWGSGDWMRDWEGRTTSAGAEIISGEGLMINEAPDEDGLEKCRNLGAEIAKL